MIYSAEPKAFISAIAMLVHDKRNFWRKPLTLYNNASHTQYDESSIERFQRGYLN